MECCGKALIQHKETHETYTIDASQLDWESDGDQREMGTETRHRASLEHPCLGDLAFEVWEYPEGVCNGVCHELHGHSLVEEFSYNFDVD